MIRVSWSRACLSRRNRNSIRHQPHRAVTRGTHTDPPSSRDQSARLCVEPMPNSSKAPEVFDPVPCLIAADWHMRNPDKNHGLLSPKALFRLIKMGWLTLTDVRRYFNPYDYVGLAHYNDKPDEQRSRSSPYPRTSRYPPLRSVYGYVVRLVLPLIRTIIRTRCFSDITLRVTRTMRERGRGREGLLLPVLRLLRYLRKRRRPRHRRWWRRRRQKRLWSKRSPSRNAGRSRVRLRRAAARNRSPYEGNAHVPKYRFRVLETTRCFFTLTFYLFSLFRYCKLSVVMPPLLLWTLCIRVRRCSLILQPTVIGPFVQLAVFFPPPLPYRNRLVITSSDGWFVSAHELHAASGLISALSVHIRLL
jgi:hypothetical protein